MNFNKIILVGNLTRDTQLSYLPNQTPVVEFGMAVNRNWTGKAGNKQEETLFIDCKMFGKRAEVINKYCDKGNPLMIEGRLCYRTWKQDDGTKRVKYEVVVESFEFVPTGEKVSAGYSEPAKKEAEQKAVDGDDVPF